MEPERIVVSFDPEAARLLADNGIDVVRELQRRGLPVEGSFGQVPGQPQGGRDVALVILSVGASTGIVSLGIAQILNALSYHKKASATERSYKPVLDAQGQAVLDGHGQPVYEVHEAQRQSDGQPVPNPGGRISARIPGIHVEMTSGAAGERPAT